VQAATGLVARRLQRYARLVGKEKHPQIAFANYAR
jgi:hypothetical protein